MILATAHNYLKKHDLKRNKEFHKLEQEYHNYYQSFLILTHITQHCYLNASRALNVLLFEIVCKQLQYLALKLAGALERLFAHFSSSS